MTGVELERARKQKGWSQQEAARKLGVSQPYLSLLERRKRLPTHKLAQKAASVFELPATALPVKENLEQISPANEKQLAEDLAALGFPGFSHLKPERKNHKKNQPKNPLVVLLAALSSDDLDARLAEALPWILLTFPEMDWTLLIRAAKLNNLQNRLGFVINLARRKAEMLERKFPAAQLKQIEHLLETARLAREDTLCHDSLTEAEKRWLRQNRPPEAEHWNLLTDLSPEHLEYA